MSRQHLARLMMGASFFLMAGAGVAHAADTAAAADTAPSAAETEKADFGTKVQEVVVTATAPALDGVLI